MSIPWPVDAVTAIPFPVLSCWTSTVAEDPVLCANIAFAFPEQTAETPVPVAAEIASPVPVPETVIVTPGPAKKFTTSMAGTLAP